MYYQIIPIFLGGVYKTKADILLDCDSNERVYSVYSCFALKNGSETIMVDTGLPSQREIEAQNLPFCRMPDAPDPESAMLASGVDPRDVSQVIWTHLHYDHCCNVHLFPNAKAFYAQKTELLYAMNPIDAQRKYYFATSDMGAPIWTQAIGRIETLDGEVEVLPGIRAVPTPGHTPGCQSIVVSTAEGNCIIAGDHIPIYDSYEKRIPNKIIHDPKDWYASCERLAQIGGKLLPSHDWSIFEKNGC